MNDERLLFNGYFVESDEARFQNFVDQIDLIGVTAKCQADQRDLQWNQVLWRHFRTCLQFSKKVE